MVKVADREIEGFLRVSPKCLGIDNAKDCVPPFPYVAFCCGNPFPHNGKTVKKAWIVANEKKKTIHDGMLGVFFLGEHTLARVHMVGKICHLVRPSQPERTIAALTTSDAERSIVGEVCEIFDITHIVKA